jgi:uncharacterized protein with FMN-binding domain
MAQNGSNKKVANSVVALSSAAVMAVYAAGYVRTRAAANRWEAQAAARIPAVVSPPPPVPAIAEVRPAAPVAAATPPVAPVSSKPARVTESKTEIAAAEPVADQVADQEDTSETGKPGGLPHSAPEWKDGTYYGWGTSRHGDIQAAVVIEGGRIVSATIAQCLTRYSCSVISNLPPEVAQRQSPEVDFVSGATQSTNAFYYGVVEALSKAK